MSSEQPGPPAPPAPTIPTAPTPATPSGSQPGARVADVLIRPAPDQAEVNRGGRPTNAQQVERATALLERITGRKVELVDPNAPPKAVSVGNDIYTREELDELKVEYESDIGIVIDEAGELLADKYDDPSLAVKGKSQKALARHWNRVFAWALGSRWLRWAPVIVAGVITVVVALPRVLKVVRHIRKQKAQQVASGEGA